ncbi:hypothetical protein BOTBODRAFT_136626 [Botryobasidium botryosum FD-172 SS1]|uniref:Heterokaryon incompatibility domain-containing protein n=1 Tax=Botryobasidium botryosum (strain FD-172 SS1) TaxID=930990 RepID=A0A067M759_BOTB1|nr:hypothetical protein BOTBODRAFT_136626 [Botryobasidium botryosum FD-172 SS1]
MKEQGTPPTIVHQLPSESSDGTSEEVGIEGRALAFPKISVPPDSISLGSGERDRTSASISSRRGSTSQLRNSIIPSVLSPTLIPATSLLSPSSASSSISHVSPIAHGYSTALTSTISNETNSTFDTPPSTGNHLQRTLIVALLVGGAVFLLTPISRTVLFGLILALFVFCTSFTRKDARPNPFMASGSQLAAEDHAQLGLGEALSACSTASSNPCSPAASTYISHDSLMTHASTISPSLIISGPLSTEEPRPAEGCSANSALIPALIQDGNLVSHGEQTPGSSCHLATARTSESGSTFSARTILRVPLPALEGMTINLDSLAVPCHFRLLDCAAFLDFNELRIIEYPDISFDSTEPLPSYAAISYPWRDLQLPPGVKSPSFSVNGATHADPISIDLLRTACIAVRKLCSCTHLWLDRLCILQTSKEDKNWQIQRMYRIYSHCDMCLVLPGGLARLAGLAEPTLWADRAWTLQEALAPGKGKVKCLFKFPHASFGDFLREACPEGNKYGFDLNISDIVETSIELGHSAACDLTLLCFKLWVGIGRFKEDAPAVWEQRDRFPVRIITTEVAELLQMPLEMGNRQGLITLWALAFARTSSRPVDMVFSTMDLLGIQLDVSQFQPDERTKATIKLIQELMKRQRGKATWLYIAPWVKPSREISTLPEMPITSESGRAYLDTSTGKVLAVDAIISEKRWRSAVGLPSPVPTGTMTDSGYFVFPAKAILVDGIRAIQHPGTMADGMRAYDDHETWAIVIGRVRNKQRNPNTWEIEPWSGEGPRPEGVYELTMMLVEKHGHNLYHRVGMEKEIDERVTIGWNWSYREFSVGGPGRGERVRFGVCAAGVNYL